MEEEKIVKSSIEKCSNCGGNLVFSPVFQSLYCENCKSTKEIDKSIDYEKHIYEENIEGKEQNSQDLSKVFKCENCGANIVLGKNEQASVCPYCQSPYVVENTEVKGLKPDIVIPFAFDKQKASECFKQGVKKKFFLPNQFKKEPPLSEIYGIYFPAFSFDSHTYSTYKGKLEKHHTVRNSDGTTHTSVSYQNISGNIEINHKDVMVETSSHLTQSQFEGIKPFDTSKFYKYNDDFIRGYSVEHYDNALDVCKKQADIMIENNIRSNILSKYSYDAVNYLNIQTKQDDEKYAYSILPTYKFTYYYGKKHYTTFMNGQTGKVDNNVPKSKVKITFFVIMILLIIAGIIALNIYFGK